jgi:hypothetical protein
VAQQGPRGRPCAPHLHRHRGRLDQVGLARVGLGLEAAPGHHRGRGVDLPLSARLTPADVADNQIAPALIEELPQEARFVLGDTHYDAQDVPQKWEQTGRFLVTSKRGAYPHTDAGVEVRRIFHKLPSLANENFRASTSRASSTYMGKSPQRARSTPRASPLGRCWSTSWPYSTAMSETRRSTVD